MGPRTNKTKSETASTRTGQSSAKARRQAKIAQFVSEFESRVVEPVVERRTALASSAQLGAGDEVVPRLPEVCDELDGFLARVAQKLDARASVPLLLQCAERLAALREHSCARDRFYALILRTCDALVAEEREKLGGVGANGGAASGRAGAAQLADGGDENGDGNDDDDEQGGLGDEEEVRLGSAPRRSRCVFLLWAGGGRLFRRMEP